MIKQDVAGKPARFHSQPSGIEAEWPRLQARFTRARPGGKIHGVDYQSLWSVNLRVVSKKMSSSFKLFRT
jgi:hypothetical protein